MDYRTKRNGYLAILIILVVAIVIAAVYVAIQGTKVPGSNSGVVLNNGGGAGGRLSIIDPNDGEMTIPNYNVPASQYDMKKFEESSGVFSYENSALGINVRSRPKGVEDIDWANVDWDAVKAGGVDFVMIRVGFRDFEKGIIQPDANFEKNIEGATAAGLDIGVYFYSAAISTLEAEGEATYVMQQIQKYQITYPVAFFWEFVTDESKARTNSCTPAEVTSFTYAFCNKIKMAKYNAAFFTGKKMGYEYFNLETLKEFDIWYTEFQKSPGFFYNFQMWQFTAEGKVSGINGDVRMTLALKKYGS